MCVMFFSKGFIHPSKKNKGKTGLVHHKDASKTMLVAQYEDPEGSII